MTTLTTPLRPPSLAILFPALPAATPTLTLPRTEADAKAYAARMNAEARRQREQHERDEQCQRHEREASAALTKRLSGHGRPATRATAKASKLNPVDVYRTYNRVRASTLPEQRSSLCEATCYGGAAVCDGQTVCWSRVLEEKGATMRGATLNVREVYDRMNHQHDAVRGYVPLGAGWRVAVDRINGARRPGPR